MSRSKKNQPPSNGWVFFDTKGDPGLARDLSWFWSQWGSKVSLNRMIDDLTQRFKFFPGDIYPDDEKGRKLLELSKKLQGVSFRLEGGEVYSN